MSPPDTSNESATFDREQTGRPAGAVPIWLFVPWILPATSQAVVGHYRLGSDSYVVVVSGCGEVVWALDRIEAVESCSDLGPEIRDRAYGGTAKLR